MKSPCKLAALALAAAFPLAASAANYSVPNPFSASYGETFYTTGVTVAGSSYTDTWTFVIGDALMDVSVNVSDPDATSLSLSLFDSQGEQIIDPNWGANWLTASLAQGAYSMVIEGTAASVPNSYDLTIFASPAPVPEPEAWAMLLAGLGLVGWRLQRRTRNWAKDQG